ncbi:hypothetical protein ACTXHA_28780 [Burkholderia cenocepacia]
MSKQSEAKASQNWRKAPDTCQRCVHFTMERRDFSETYGNTVYEWSKDTNMRCAIGGFKTSKTNVCDRFEQKGGEAEA